MLITRSGVSASSARADADPARVAIAMAAMPYETFMLPPDRPGFAGDLAAWTAYLDRPRLAHLGSRGKPRRREYRPSGGVRRQELSSRPTKSGGHHAVTARLTWNQ